MIPCTEIIPAYSELFSFIEKKYGRSEVDKLWYYLFAPTGEGIPLVNFIKKEGIKGCFSYWSGTLNEEAADFTLYLNEKSGWFAMIMHKCPSKGLLLDLEQNIDIKPYHDYCMHCDHYRVSCEKLGLKYIYNFIGIDKASCSIYIYDPQKFSGKMIVDDDTLIMDRRTSDNEYFHKDFHSSLNMGVDYLGEKYGKDVLEEFLVQYTKHVYKEQLEKIKEDGLSAIEKVIKEMYLCEKASHVLCTELYDDKLEIRIESCPAVEYLQKTGRRISNWYKYTTETIMKVFALECEAEFVMIEYDNKTGKSNYKFEI